MGYILITGGQLFNKGAQAMVFTVVNEIKKKFPNKKIVLLSSRDFLRNNEDKNQYTFDIMPYSNRLKLSLAGGVYNFINTLYKPKRYIEAFGKYEKTLRNYFENAKMILDISGYGLSSQWGFTKSLFYIMNIIIAKKFKKKIYLLPQTLGPFNYKSIIAKTIIKCLLKKYLPYPSLIFVREKESISEIKKFTQNNVLNSNDIVLQNKHEYSLDYIYKKGEPNVKNPIIINKNAICIVPNQKTLVHGNSQDIYKTYKIIIERLLKEGTKIYLLCHSEDDLPICQKIKSDCNDNRVVILNRNYNCLELKDIISQFNFIIASRYHAVIHAYKTGVPVVVLGWSDKYRSLLDLFTQTEYLFDVRNEIMPDLIEEKIIEMGKNHIICSKIIIQKLKQIQSINIFNTIYKINKEFDNE